MKKKKIKNPLSKRVFRELGKEWRKYLVIFLFLVLTIGFVSGMYVANESMLASIDESKTLYKLEDGHFELEEKADEKLISAIESGEKADLREFYLNKAKKELDEKFEDEFRREFNSAFNSEFSYQFELQVKQTLLAQGLDESTASAMLGTAVEQAKQNGTYDSAYWSAYNSAYQSAYDEAYDEAWSEVQDEVNEKYAEAEEKYELNDPDFKEVKVKLYENFFKNADEDSDSDGESNGTVRVYKKTDEINTADLLDGRFPEKDEEIAIDRMHADNVGVKVGDFITVSGKKYEVVGLLAYVNYSTLHEKATDLMFDAIGFDVAMVTPDAFELIDEKMHYAYAWKYEETPGNEKEEKAASDDFSKALMTQSIVAENDIEDYLPRYANPAVTFAEDDMGSDKSMGGVLLYILVVIIGFIFAVTITNTISKESSAIGTLRASGYTKGELTRHYIAMPVAVTLIASAVGNVLGYTVFKNVVVSMYYNSYSLPGYKTLWNTDAFTKTTVVPVVLMFIVNLGAISKMMNHTPLEFLRGNLKKSKRQKTMRLPNVKFFSRFRMRIILQNAANYIILIIGVFFVMVLLAMSIGLPSTLKYYQDNAENMMFAKYQYILSSYEDEDGDLIETENPDAEKFSISTLVKRSNALDEEISVYSVEDESKYIKTDGISELKDNEVFISETFSEKYSLGKGDIFELEEKYENKTYEFKVAGIYDKSISLAVFMPEESYSTTFELKENEFGGFLSDTEITDIDEDYIATVITKADITKMCDQMNHSMGSYMDYFSVLCAALSAVLIYMLSTLIIEKNESAISMTKILGYTNGEIGSLYLNSTTIVLLAADAAGAFGGVYVMKELWRQMLLTYNGWFEFRMEPDGYVKMFLFVLIGYMAVMLLNYRRIKRVPMSEALKDAE